MPLPSESVSWPPTPAPEVSEWAAWYSGDPEALATFYGGRTGVQNHANQLRGGVVGAIARWWWGQPIPEGEQRAKLHVPLAADICGNSADLLFSEPVRFMTDNVKLDEFLAGLQEDGLDSRLHEGGEVAAGLGGAYLRTVWDQSLSPRPWTEIAHPDGAVPVFRAGRLQEVSLWTELASLERAIVHRLVEHHSPGLIQYALYRGTGTNLGKRVSVLSHPDAAHLATIPGVEDIDQVLGQQTGVTGLTVKYVPNMLPNRLHRNSPQGRSDLQGVTPLLDALDEAYSSWWRDIRHAKGRIHVPAQYLSTDGPGTAGAIDLDREVYVPVEGVLGTGKDGLMITAQQFEIRVAQHRDTCDYWTDRIIDSAGYTPPSQSADGGAATATEINSRDRRTNMTRGKKIRYWSAVLREHARTQAEVANVHLGAGLSLDDVRVEFQDGVQESAMSLAQTAFTLKNAMAASTQTLVELVHPDWEPQDVSDEVARILAENGQGEPVPNPNDAGF